MRTLTVEADQLPNRTLFGLHMNVCEFTESERPDMSGHVDHNIGLGGISLCITVKVGEREMKETLDLTPLINEWAGQIETELREP